jgi:hypothetical protein
LRQRVWSETEREKRDKQLPIQRSSEMFEHTGCSSKNLADDFSSGCLPAGMV